MFVAYFAGLRLGLGLIVAIGAQNAFVLRQGLRREHVLATCAFCALADAGLIALGVGGFALASDRMPWLAPALRWGGDRLPAVVRRAGLPVGLARRGGA